MREWRQKHTHLFVPIKFWYAILDKNSRYILLMRHSKHITNPTVKGFILSSFMAFIVACAPSDLVIEGSVSTYDKKIPVQIGIYIQMRFLTSSTQRRLKKLETGK